MSKRIPIYLSEEELKTLEIALYRLKVYSEYNTELENTLYNKLLEEIATFKD